MPSSKPTVTSMRYDFPIRPLFPEAPLIVRPRKATQRWSSHQYGGANDPLCLEYGPDNWHPGVTGVMMLESAHKLLEIENPLGENRKAIPVTAPSRHQLTIGEELRGTWIRWYRSAELKHFFADCGRPAGSLKFSLRTYSESCLVLVHEATPFGDETWKDARIPRAFPAPAQATCGMVHGSSHRA